MKTHIKYRLPIKSVTPVRVVKIINESSPKMKLKIVHIQKL